PGWPLPARSTASAARILAVSTARLSVSVQLSDATVPNPRRGRSGARRRLRHVTQTLTSEAATGVRATGLARVRAFVALTKPRVGGTLAAGSANAFNMWFDRDIDRLMSRTKSRPLAIGSIGDREAIVFAWVLGVVATAWLWLFAGWLPAVLAVAAIAFYVLVY